MPIGVSDSWWGEGVVSRVMVNCADLDKIAKCFGEPGRWWPRNIEGIPEEWWLRFPRFGAESDEALSRIRAYIMREPDIEWSTVAVARSVTAPDSEDDDYHRPLYEDAISACSLHNATGPEVMERPVTLAQRLSRSLNSAAVAFWASDEEPALGGVCLVTNGDVEWGVSIVNLTMLKQAAMAYVNESAQDVEIDEEAGWTNFWLYQKGQAESCVQGDMQNWTDEQFRKLGCGVDWGVDPVTVHPYDFPSPMSDFVDEFVIAIQK